jgi:hypothetical protein
VQTRTSCFAVDQSRQGDGLQCVGKALKQEIEPFRSDLKSECYLKSHCDLCFADVRCRVHYGLKSDIAPRPFCAKSRNQRIAALLIRSNDMRTGSNPDVSSQVTVITLGYFGQT